MFVIKSGDTAPPFEAVLAVDGVPVDLTGATVLFLMERNRTNVVSGEAVIGGEDGEVSYAWQEGDTDTPGIYLAEWEVTFSDNTVRTFPNDGYSRIKILREVDEGSA